jgi:hypothetical protein
MNTCLSSLILFGLAYSALADDGKSIVRFSNSDRLCGSLELLTTDRLVWNSSVLEKPTPFFLKNVIDLTQAAEASETKASHEAVVTLTNGDLLRGQLVAVADDAVELDTWMAGRMKINRLMISNIRINEPPKSIYRGPTGLNGWTQSGEKPAWTYRNSEFRAESAGSIAKDVKLPDECRIAFNATWRGSLGLEVDLFSNDLATDRPASGYAMTFRQRFISLRRGKDQQSLGNAPHASALQENEKARIEVRASLKSGKICVLVDDHLIEVWTDPNMVQNELGRGIHFVSLGSTPVQISQIEITAWDGEVGKVSDPQLAAGLVQLGMLDEQDSDEDQPPALVEILKQGRMELRNGDNLAGEVVSIAGEMITVKTPFREVKLPIHALRSISLKAGNLERCKRENGDVRGWLADGSSVVFRLDDVKEGSLKGFSQNFGTVEFKLSAFSRIEFNIYDPKLEEVRVANGW